MKRRSFVVAAALLLFASPNLASRPLPTPGPTPKLVVLGHAGSGFFTPISPFNFRPPSSWRGVEYALDLGADGIEVDLQLSRDSVVMLYHDQELANSSTGRGCISQHRAAELVQLRYRGGWTTTCFSTSGPSPSTPCSPA